MATIPVSNLEQPFRASVEWDGHGRAVVRLTGEFGKPLDAADTDAGQDVYLRNGASFSLISIGPNGGNAPGFSAFFAGASGDASKAFFQTRESLASDDTDSSLDIYERSGSTTTLVSTGAAGGNGAFDATFNGASSDGTRVILSTQESLIGFPDTDAGQTDVYERSGGTTRLLSYGSNSFDGPYGAFYQGISDDATHVFFVTSEALVSADANGTQDVYERFGTTTRPVSVGVGYEYYGASFAGSTPDGTHVFFARHSGCGSFQQVYDRTGGTVFPLQ